MHSAAFSCFLALLFLQMFAYVSLGMCDESWSQQRGHQVQRLKKVSQTSIFTSCLSWMWDSHGETSNTFFVFISMCFRYSQAIYHGTTENSPKCTLKSYLSGVKWQPLPMVTCIFACCSWPYLHPSSLFLSRCCAWTRLSIVVRFGTALPHSSHLTAWSLFCAGPNIAQLPPFHSKGPPNIRSSWGHANVYVQVWRNTDKRIHTHTHTYIC